jgi:pyruvate kinase
LRPDVPVVAFTPTQACAASLGLQRGIQPVVLEVDGDDPTAISEAVIAAVRSGRGVLGLATDDAIVLVQTSARAGPNALELVRV